MDVSVALEPQVDISVPLEPQVVFSGPLEQQVYVSPHNAMYHKCCTKNKIFRSRHVVFIYLIFLYFLFKINVLVHFGTDL